MRRAHPTQAGLCLDESEGNNGRVSAIRGADPEEFPTLFHVELSLFEIFAGYSMLSFGA
jgi:hypothetical protein